jgi:hypothetical protein
MVSQNDLFVCALRSYGALYTFLDSSYTIGCKVYNAVVNAFEPSYWIFFQSKQDPVPLQQVSFYAKGSMTPEWTYDVTSSRFTPLVLGEHPSATFKRSTGRLRIPILSLNIRRKGTYVIYDLTDFLETVRICYVNGLHNATPTLAQLIGAWSLHSGVVLDWSHGLFVTLINQNGMEYCVQYEKIHTPVAEYNQESVSASAEAKASAEAEAPAEAKASASAEAEEETAEAPASASAEAAETNASVEDSTDSLVTEEAVTKVDELPPSPRE